MQAEAPPLPAGYTVDDAAPPPPSGYALDTASNAPPAPLSGPISGAGTVPAPAELQGEGSDAAASSLKRAVLGPNPVGDTLMNAGRHLYSDTVGTAQAMLRPAGSMDEQVAQDLMPGGLQVYRAAIEPSIQPAKDAEQAFQDGRYGDAANDAMDAIPVVGPYARNFENEVGKDGLLPAAAGAAVDYATGKAISAAGAKLAQAGTMVPGENYTAGQHASLSGVLGRGSTADKGFFPKETSTDIGSSLRQAAADNPAIHKTIMNGTPEESLAGTQALLQKVREGIDTQHAQALSTVASDPINPKPLQDAVSFPKSLAGFAPDDAAAIQDLKGRLGNIRTLGGLNDLRMYLNKELSQQFKLSKVAAGNSGAVTGAMEDALKATRDLYYKELERATGGNFQGLKRQEGSVLSAEEALQNASPKLAARQAIAEQPLSTRTAVGEALEGAHTLSGSPIAGAARMISRKLLGQTPMTPVREGLQNFFRGADRLPPSAPTTQYGQYVPPAAAQQPPTAPAAAPGRLQPPSPATIPAQPSAALSVGTSVGNTGTPPAITAAQNARLAPGGRVRLLPAGTGNPEFVRPGTTRTVTVSPEGTATITHSSYPPLNEATARTNVNAGTPRPVQEEIPQRTISVSPEGQGTIQRPALPPPETHAFDSKAWAAANPKGDLANAIKRAQRHGYEIIY